MTLENEQDPKLTLQIRELQPKEKHGCATCIVVYKMSTYLEK